MNKPIKWFHSLTLNGEVMPGDRPADILEREAAAVFAHPLVGKSVLDIGAWDGYFSFEAERRGAARVLSTDHFCWSGPGWGTKRGYDFAHEALGSKCESLDVDVFDLDPKVHGTFDVVLFMGVLYHLTDPYGGLRKAAAMTDDLLIVETVTAQNQNNEAVLQYYENDSLDGDKSNYFAPNTKALAGMLREIGFSRVEIVRNPGSPLIAAPSVKLKRTHWKKKLKSLWGAYDKTNVMLAPVPDRDRHIAFAWRE